jgi:hypothetical protein
VKLPLNPTVPPEIIEGVKLIAVFSVAPLLDTNNSDAKTILINKGTNITFCFLICIVADLLSPL